MSHDNDYGLKNYLQENNVKKNKRKVRKWNLRLSPKYFAERAKSYLLLFLNTSTIHGLKHLVVAGRHPLEVILWLLIVAISLFGSVFLAWTTWIRYQNSPTVISMDRDMFSWNTSFPAVTICLETKLDMDKLNNYIGKSNETDKDLLERFLRTLSNATFNNFDQIPEYQGIPPEKYLDVLVALMTKFNPMISIGVTGVSLQVVTTVTEMGICNAINSNVAVYSSPKYIAAKRWDIVDSKDKVFYIHPLDGEVLAQVVKINGAYNAYVHGTFEVPDISKKFYHAEENYYCKVHVTATSIYTSPEAAKLTVGQRRCRFIHENNLPHFSVYTYTMCRMECRIRLCLHYCQCIPFFYRPIGNEKICDVKGMHCLAKYKDELYDLRDSKGKKIACDCYPLCDDVNYVMQFNSLQKWTIDTNFQWGMVTFPRLRYRRDIIFRFTDVLVAIGGMGGLFLGCSVLSFLEILYFLILWIFKVTTRVNP
ncbi:sodium channel protein Nach-like [Aricia agestis]|uniref:sodium channel protein Nach-like n=1 Tax=Aricia agestis TaxID=91739 RepID=UPI001C20B227|nr:sodium channel protein Nach-like [Aricia agestis]